MKERLCKHTWLDDKNQLEEMVLTAQGIITEKDLPPNEIPSTDEGFTKDAHTKSDLIDPLPTTCISSLERRLEVTLSSSEYRCIRLLACLHNSALSLDGSHFGSAQLRYWLTYTREHDLLGAAVLISSFDGLLMGDALYIGRMSLKTDVLGFLFSGDPGSFQNFVSEFRDSKLNETTELALLHGIYTGIISIALWNIFNNKSRSIGRVMVAITILLYIATTINFFLNLAFLRYVFNFHEDLLYPDEEVYLFYIAVGTYRMSDIGISITAVMSTVIADSIMIWRCWMVWGRRWPIVLLPILCLISGFVCRILDMIAGFAANLQIMGGLDVSFLVIYISCILATTLWCTTLIVIRILTVTRGANDRLRDYRHIIEVLVESSALHSVTLIVYIALETSHNTASDYFNTLAAITTGVAPTLLAGRVAAGHARPDDSWEGSIMSSLRFEAHPQADAETCSRIDSLVDDDLEAQSIQVDEPEEIGAEKKRI
ncbi:uncharacterized protein ARMOST_21343 [Armillaria ostoyae]|uniref:Uncharacterized protein n=1 Tax=Armillaria ostoyae TaxID=47428 RepID=A0A284S9U8_ARMOS|nr:uncharacterized protein ARMOST_21343 [Armillaria ostoyae]